MPVVNREVVLPVAARARLGADHRAVRARGLARRRGRVRARRGRAAARHRRRRDPRGRRRRGRRARADRVPLGRLARRVGARGPSRRHALPRHRAPLRRRHDHLGPEADGARARLAAVPGVDEVFSALSDPTRREVLRSVAPRPELTASRLAGELPITRQAVAKHLAALQRAGLVEPRREGRETRYTLTPAPARGRDGLDGRGRRELGPAPRTSGGARARVGEAACPPPSSPAPPAASASATAERLLADGYDVLAVDLEPDGPGRPFAADLTTREGNADAVDRGAGALRPARPRRRQRRHPARRAGARLPRGPLGRDHRAPADQPVPAGQVRLGRAGRVRRRAASSPSPPPTRSSPRPTRPPTWRPSTACSGSCKTLALEGGDAGITATAVCPGYVRTPLVEGQLADQAKAHDMTEERGARGGDPRSRTPSSG